MKSEDITSMFWNIVFWIGIALIIGWALAKSFGVINTPLWIEMIPVFGGGLSLAAGGIAIGKYMGKIAEKLDTVCKDVHEMKRDIKEIQKNAICLRTGACSLS